MSQILSSAAVVIGIESHRVKLWMNEIKETLVCQMYRVVSFIDTVIDVYKFSFNERL